MSNDHLQIEWRERLHFQATTQDNRSIPINGPPECGGQNRGFRPMDLILLGVGGCTAIDVMHILHKSRRSVSECVTCISAVWASEDPKVFESIHLSFALVGADLTPELVERAIALSAEKYCSASIMMSRAGVRVTHDFTLNVELSDSLSSSTEPNSVSTLGLRHVALLSNHYEASRKFYCEVMGMEVEWEPDSDNVYLTSGHDNLAIHRAFEKHPIQNSRLDHLGFIVKHKEDVDQWHEHLIMNEITIVAQPKNHRDGARSCYVLDPDGVKIQIIYHPPLSDT